MRKLSKAEAGKLGADKSRITCAKQKQDRIDNYLTKPNICIQCNTVLDYEKRHNKFCGSSCSATYSNTNRKQKPKGNCLNCDKEIYHLRKYCNHACNKEANRKERIRQWLEEGKDWKLQTPDWARSHLAEIKGYVCEDCGVDDTYNGKKIVLEVDHIDGHHYNNDPSNLRFLCPNCHSQTDTYKSKNRGHGRNRKTKPI